MNRRWFSSSDMDLIFWTDETASVTSFELYYDKHIDEHVLIWRRNSGFRHLAVDDGEQKPVLNYKETPILVPDGIFDPDRIRRLFGQVRDELPEAVAEVIGRELGRLKKDTRSARN